MSQCSYGGSLMLVKQKIVDAELYGFNGCRIVKHQAKRCVRRNCRQYYWLNYKWSQGCKINTVKLHQVSCLFITDKTGFELNFLEYHETLHFRGFLSSSSVLYALTKCLVKESKRNTTRLKEYYNDARFLRLVMMELPEEHIEIEKELNQNLVNKYDEIVHVKVFPPKIPLSVTEISGDGNEKVMIKLCKESAPAKRSGQSSKTKKLPKPYMNGWWMLTTPKTGRILCVIPMYNPENNAIKLESLDKVLHLYPKCDTFLHDCACKLAPEAIKTGKYKQIVYWSVDRFHAKKHGKSCKYSPYNDDKLQKRLDGINTSISEQVFNWFRSYARNMNKMNRFRHQFLVYYYCKLHNEILESEETRHLNKYSFIAKGKKKRNQRRYECRRIVCKI